MTEKSKRITFAIAAGSMTLFSAGFGIFFNTMEYFDMGDIKLDWSKNAINFMTHWGITLETLIATTGMGIVAHKNFKSFKALRRQELKDKTR